LRNKLIFARSLENEQPEGQWDPCSVSTTDQLLFDSFACSKATGLLYCKVECNRIGL
jgi:hypothetical protein